MFSEAVEVYFNKGFGELEERLREMTREEATLTAAPDSLLQRLAKVFDYIFILRPTLFFPVWTVFAAGYFASWRYLAGPAPASSGGEVSWPLVVAMALTFLMGSVFILNQIVDVETDRKNNKLFLIAHGHIHVRLAMAEAIILGVLAIGVTLFYDWRMGGLFATIFFVTGVLYSLAPFKWKDRPIAGLVTNCLGAILIFSAGWWTRNFSFALPLLHAMPYMLAVAAVYIYTTLLDITGDARFQKITFAVRFGKRAAIHFGTALELAALGLAWFYGDPVIFYPALFSAPFFLIASLHERDKDVIRAIKFPILLLALAVSVLWPMYFVILVITYYFSKFYYHYRFGLRYPSLDPS